MKRDAKIECALLTNDDVHLLFPISALAEVCEISNERSILNDKIVWRSLELSVYDFAFQSVSIQNLSNVKIVIINALFSADCSAPPFFALCFNGEARRKDLSSKTVKWLDEKMRVVHIFERNEKITAKVFDLFAFSKMIEKKLMKL